MSAEPLVKNAFCPHCGNNSHHRLVYHHQFEEKDSALDGMYEADFFLAVCETCDRALLYYMSSLEDYVGDEYAQFQSAFRVLGNLRAHTPDRHLGEYDASMMDDLFRAILEYVYIGPSKLRKLRSTLQNATKKESAGEKASERPPNPETRKPTVH